MGNSERPPRLIYLLTTAQRRLEASIERHGDGLTAARAGLLLALTPNEGMSMKDLAKTLDLRAPALSGLVDRMSKAGLVQRHPAPDDGRSSLVELTVAGRDARRTVAIRTKAFNDDLCEGFTSDEIRIVERWLDTVRTKYAPQ